MVNKKLVTLSCVVFVVGLLIGILTLNSDIQNFNGKAKTYPVDAHLVYAYFKVFNASANSGIAYNQLVTYILVLNITNPSDTTLLLRGVKIRELGNAGAFDYEHDFSDSQKYAFNSNTSTLVAFSQTSGVTPLYNYPSPFRNQSGFTGVISAAFYSEKGNGGADVTNKFEIQITSVSPDEYVFGAAFNQDSLLYFTNQHGFISAWPVTGRIG